MSSWDSIRIRAQFKVLPPDEKKAFIAYVRDYLKAKSFGLHHLIKAKREEGIECPHCRNKDPKEIVRFGTRKGIQWYRCKPCGKTFSNVTGTLWSRTRKEFHVWAQFVQCMMDGHSIRKSAELCELNTRTAFMWRHKVLDALAQYHGSQPQMKGIVEADDTFFRLSYKGGKPIGRKAHRRGEKATKRGLSKEQVCVSCAIERNGQVFSRVSALGTPKAEALQCVFKKRFAKKAIVCTDNATAYVKYCKNSRFQYIQVPNGIKALDIYHVQHVNAYHSQLKQFISQFKGVATKYLNNYLVYFNLIKKGGRNRQELLKLAVKALVFDRWSDISSRPAVPLPAVAALAGV